MSEQIEILRRAMTEVALLAPDDPRRLALVQQVLSHGKELQQEWLALLHDDEQLRLKLNQVQVPAGMQQALLSIPDEKDPTSSPRRRIRFWRIGLAAVLIIGVVSGLLVQWTNRDFHQNTHRLAGRMVRQHLAPPALAIQTSSIAQVEQAMDGYLPFPTDLPDLGQDYVLQGAAKGSIDGHHVVYTRWRYQGRECSLYQFCPKQFDLPGEFSLQHRFPDTTSDEHGQYRVAIWTVQHCAYALVVHEQEGERVRSLRDAI